MNILFLVEGRRTEKGLYKNWVHYLCESLTYVNSLPEVNDNNFTIISGGGFPNYLDIIHDALLDLRNNQQINYLFICVDSEQLTYDEKFAQINTFLRTQPRISGLNIIIIVQNHCIETWLMGNRRVDIGNTTNPDLIEYRNHYNVNNSDPEHLESMHGETIAEITYDYLRLMLKEHNMRYSKNTLHYVGNRQYLNEIISRFRENGHLRSFGFFYSSIINLCNEIHSH